MEKEGRKDKKFRSLEVRGELIALKKKSHWKSNFCNFHILNGQKLCFKERSCWRNIQFLLMIYLLRHKYLQHSSWLHSTLCTNIYENGRYSLQFCRKTLSEIGIRYSNPLIVPSKGCVKGSFFLFFQHTIEPRKRKANPLKSSNYFLYISLIEGLKI